MSGYIIKRHQKLKVLGRVDGFYRVFHNEKIGYTNPGNFTIESIIIEKNRRKDSLLIIANKEEGQRLAKIEEEKGKNRKIQERKQREKEAQLRKQIEEEYNLNKALYGVDIANKIIGKKVWLGMTSEMARKSWGRPTDINRAVNAYGVSEQWVYGDITNRTYLYFDDGILTSWQD